MNVLPAEIVESRPVASDELWPNELAKGRFRRVRSQLNLLLPVGFIVFLLLACFLWPEIYPVPSPTHANLFAISLPPLTPGHLFGTDPLGEDIFSRTLYGGRVSLEVGVGSVGLGLLIGGSIGLTAGYFGGTVDTTLSRVLDCLLAFPPLVLAIIVATYLGPSEVHVIWAISFFSIPYYGRLSRAATLRLTEQTFITAAMLSGTKRLRVILRHVVPNVAPQLLTYGLLGVGVSIIIEASLSFLGLGVRPPQPSWGNMIAIGQQNIANLPDLLVIPSAFLFATVFSLNRLGDALRFRWGVQ
jgi:peptide/nickel transport system permease protein